MHLRLRQELRPAPGERVGDEPVDGEAPALQRDLRLDAEIQHRPVLHLPLPGRQALGGGIGRFPREQPAFARPFLLALDQLLLDAADEAGVLLVHPGSP